MNLKILSASKKNTLCLIYTYAKYRSMLGYKIKIQMEQSAQPPTHTSLHQCITGAPYAACCLYYNVYLCIWSSLLFPLLCRASPRLSSIFMRFRASAPRFSTLCILMSHVPGSKPRATARREKDEGETDAKSAGIRRTGYKNAINPCIFGARHYLAPAHELARARARILFAGRSSYSLFGDRRALAFSAGTIPARSVYYIHIYVGS